MYALQHVTRNSLYILECVIKHSITSLSLQGKIVAITSRESVCRFFAGGSPVIFESS